MLPEWYTSSSLAMGGGKDSEENCLREVLNTANLGVTYDDNSRYLPRIRM